MPTQPPTDPPCRACAEDTEIFPFTMAFQPVVDLAERRIDSYEALVRGPAGEGAGFVPGQLTKDNRYAFDQACRVKEIELATRLGIHRLDDRCRLSINFLPNAVYARPPASGAPSRPPRAPAFRSTASPSRSSSRRTWGSPRSPTSTPSSTNTAATDSRSRSTISPAAIPVSPAWPR